MKKKEEKEKKKKALYPAFFLFLLLQARIEAFLLHSNRERSILRSYRSLLRHSWHFFHTTETNSFFEWNATSNFILFS